MNKSIIRELTFKLLYSLEIQKSYNDEDIELYFEGIELESDKIKSQIKEDVNNIIKYKVIIIILEIFKCFLAKFSVLIILFSKTF